MPKSLDIITVVCPTCGKVYETKIKWVGRGTPRIRCDSCKIKILEFDDRNFYIIEKA
jgi:transposase-like protein